MGRVDAFERSLEALHTKVGRQGAANRTPAHHDLGEEPALVPQEHQGRSRLNRRRHSTSDAIKLQNTH
eukprot:8488249-Pyramimonas_sp.AAC.1